MSSGVSVDIIVPNYNKSPYLEEAITSVINQTFQNWYLYIIDNNSTDNSQIIIDSLNKKNKKIRPIFLKRNKGVSFSRNLGLRISSSKYVCFLDSDDVWDAKKLQKQVNFMEQYNYAFSYTNYTPFIVSKGKKSFLKTIIPPLEFTYKKFLKNTSISTSTMIVNRQIIKFMKFPKVKTLEDYIFKCNLLKKTNAIKLNLNTTYYRILKKSLSSSKIKNIYWLFILNSEFNKLNFLDNFISIINISINSIKKYGIK